MGLITLKPFIGKHIPTEAISAKHVGGIAIKFIDNVPCHVRTVANMTKIPSPLCNTPATATGEFVFADLIFVNTPSNSRMAHTLNVLDSFSNYVFPLKSKDASNILEH